MQFNNRPATTLEGARNASNARSSAKRGGHPKRRSATDLALAIKKAALMAYPSATIKVRTRKGKRGGVTIRASVKSGHPLDDAPLAAYLAGMSDLFDIWGRA